MFQPLLAPARYKGAKGGRGSGKSHFFAELLVEESLLIPGLRTVCIREVQKSLKQSAKKLIEDKLNHLNVGPEFDVLNGEIKTPGGGVMIFEGMQDHTAESIKSLEGFQRAWVEEAQALSKRSLTLLRPTIRAEGSQLLFSWNPRRKTDAVDEFLVEKKPHTATVVTANWRDNPWFPSELEEERLTDLEAFPDQYDHVWEGEYATAFEGAYFSKQLSEAKQQGRIGKVAADPLLPIRTYHDIGGSGASSDAYTIWVVQFVGQEIRILDYYEAQGQTLAFHVAWMRERGYEGAKVFLPHDGVNPANNVTGGRYEDAWRDAGFEVEVIPNQGKGAAMQRVRAVQRLFPQMWFNAATTGPGREALGYYHERRDEARNIGLGPEHDWSSHGADALGLMAVHWTPPQSTAVPETMSADWLHAGGY